MQELGPSSTNLVGNHSTFLWSASGDRRVGHPTTGPLTPSILWAKEQAALERAQQAHAQSIMLLVHELRAPAAASKSMVSALRYLNPQDAQLGSFLSRIENRMDQLLDLVDDILSLSEAKAGPPLERTATLDLVAETKSVCRIYQEDAAAKGLAMSVELPSSSLWVHMADRAYYLLISNLLSNAVKYTLTGSVRVTLRKNGHWAVLSVQDTGIGIPPGDMSRICTEFFRASNARASRTPGTGLGLAAVKALVDGCGGELALESQEGRGSRFTVRLPLSRAEVTRDARSRLRTEGNLQ